MHDYRNGECEIENPAISNIGMSDRFKSITSNALEVNDKIIDLIHHHI
jgi:hypothetical protein